MGNICSAHTSGICPELMSKFFTNINNPPCLMKLSTLFSLMLVSAEKLNRLVIKDPSSCYNYRYFLKWPIILANFLLIKLTKDKALEAFSWVQVP